VLLRQAFAYMLMLGLLLISSPALSAVQLTAESSGLPLNPYIELLEDHSAQLSIADMADPAIQSRFQPANGRASVGQSRNPWWIKVTLQRTADAPTDWWLEVNSVTQLDLRLYLPDEHGAWQARQSGERVSHAEGRDRTFRHMLFKLPTLAQQPLTFYLRTYDPAGNSFPMKVWQLDDLTQQASEENLVLGVVYGIIAALLLYNLFIFLSLRDSAYFGTC